MISAVEVPVRFFGRLSTVSPGTWASVHLRARFAMGTPFGKANLITFL